MIASAGPVEPYDWRHNSLMDAKSFMEQRATAIGMLGRYIIKSVFPYEFSYDYSYPAIPNTGFGNAWVLFGLFASLTGLFFAVRNFRKNTAITFGILFFFITISLTSNIFKIIGATMADRFLYVPSLGVALLISALVIKIPGVARSKFLPVMMVLPLVIFYSAKTISRNSFWVNNAALYLKDVQTVQNSGRTNYNAATILMNEVVPSFTDTNDRKLAMNDARQYLIRSVELDPREPKSWINLGVVNYRSRLYLESARATRNALHITPNDTTLFANLGDAYFMAKMYDSSMYYHNILVRGNKIYYDTWNFLGNAYFNKQDYAKAAECFAAGLKKNPAYSDLWVNYGNALAMSKRYSEAISSFRKAYELNQRHVNAIYFIALTYQNMGVMDSTKKYLDIYNKLKANP